MNKNMMIITGAVALVLAGLAFTLNSGSNEKRVQSSDRIGQYFLPELNENLNDAAKVTIRGNGEETTLVKVGEKWGIEQKSQYPGKMETLRKLLIDLSELKVEEQKTARPEAFEELELREPIKKTASKQVVVTTSDNTELANVILGKINYGSGGSGRGTQFVRYADENQTWLVDNYITTNATVTSWLETDFLDIENSRVKNVTINHEDGSVVSLVKESEEDTVLQVINLPEGMEQKSDGIGNTMAGVFRSMRLDDVVPVSSLTFPESPVATTMVETFDGLIVQTDLYQLEEKDWLVASAATTEEASDEVKDEAELLNNKNSDWAYNIPKYITTRLARKLDYFAKPIEENPEEIAGPPAMLQDASTTGTSKGATTVPDLSEEEIQQLIQQAREQQGKSGNN